MSYVKTEQRYGRDEKVIDLATLAADIAPVLGGTVQPAGEFPRDHQTILIGADLLHLTADNHKRRVRVYVSASDVKHGDRNTYDKSHNTESATIGAERDAEAIAKDIKRRVVDASQEALTKQREHAAKLKTQRETLKATAETLQAETGIEVRVDEGNLNASLYNRGGHSLDGRMSADGTVSINYIGSMSLPTFKRVLAALKGDAAEPESVVTTPEPDADVAQLKADLASMEAAVEELETEIVEERTKALEAQNKVDELHEELKEKNGEIERLKDDDTVSTAADALSSWLVANGYPARPLKVDDTHLQTLVDYLL